MYPMPLTRTSTDSFATIHREAIAQRVPEIAGYLQQHLGQHVTAYLAGLNDPKMVGRWIQNRCAPRELSEFRLREGYQAARLLVTAYGDQAARAWFFGTNFFLGRAPAAVLRTAETPDETHEVVAAARRFVAEELASCEDERIAATRRGEAFAAAEREPQRQKGRVDGETRDRGWRREDLYDRGRPR
jgi:hypothetical protein